MSEAKAAELKAFLSQSAQDFIEDTGCDARTMGR